MDSHSRSASPREPARPQHRPPSPPASPHSGFDNRAYTHDESDPNHNDSFTSNGAQQNHQNGHTKEPNGDTKTLEAVNLELINLTPKNGSKKKDVEVDMNAASPYDEYFVPVNEHRKYMRGEKLYVTADKRGEKGGCKRPLCWTLLALVVVAIIALIVLAATGILFTNSPTPLEQYNASVSSARAFGGITSDLSNNHGDHHDHSDHDHDHSDHGHDHSEHDHNHGQEQNTLPPQSGTETQSDEAQIPMTSEETGDTSMYVPRTLEGTLKIDNEIFTPEFEDTESEKYRDFTTSFSDALKHALFNRNTLENGDNEILIEVIQIRNGSLVVTYRIHWSPKYNSVPTEDLLTANTLKTNLNNYLNDNSRMISVYHVAEEELPTTQVLDLCKINNYDCEYKCEFDDSTLDFMCVCPQGQIVDMRAPKRCMPLLDDTENMHPETTTQKESNVLNSNSNEITPKTNSEEKVNTESVRLANEENMFDWKEPHRDTPETTTETEPDLNFSHIFGPDSPKPEPEPSAEPEGIPIPEPTLSPKPEDESDSITEPKPEPEPTAGPQIEPVPEPSAEPKPELEAAPEPTSEPKPEPEPTAEPTAESKPESESAPEPTAEPKPEAEPTSEPTAEPKVEPEPTAEPNPEPDPSSSPKSDQQTNVVPETASSTETLQEPESIASPQLEVKPTTDETSNESLDDVTSASPETSVTSETIISVKDMPVFSAEQDTKQDELNTTSKPSVMFDHPTFDLDSIIGFHTTAEPESYQDSETDLSIKPLENNENGNEGKEKIITTTMRISISEPHVINEPSYEPKPEIISILREDGQRMNVTSIDPSNYTAIESDWLEAHDENNNKGSETTTRNVNEQMDTEMNDEGSSEHVNRPEQRSSKKFEDFTFESSTNSIIDNNNEDITFDLIKGNNEKLPVLTTTEPTTDNAEDVSDKVTSNINKIETTTMFINKMNDLTENDMKEQEKNENKEVIEENNTEVVMQNKDSNDISNVTSTEKESTEKMADVTFDNISMIYNRSSKSIEKEASKNQESTESNEVLTDESEVTTTDSDWLSESVTEVNYENIMNKMEKQETTETPKTKIDEIMGSGVTKDDFEPDYLSNVGIKTTKMSDQDEPLYGMTQDYDNEDPRVKRVNMEKDKAEMNNRNSIQEPSTVTNLTTEAGFETTTIGQYIYQALAQNMSNSVQNSEGLLSSPMPAPVWEESDLSVKELPKQSLDVNNQQVDGTNIASTTLPVISVFNNQLNQDNSTGMDDLMLQNTTQVSNLNVTIYEISSHSRNQSISSSKPTNSPSTEFVDHEPEMNPFLPEVENNKSLVKKLQEGHDLEPTNLNETQNENIEEHTHGVVDILSSIDSKQTAESIETNKTNATSVIMPQTESEATTSAVEDEDYLFNQLFTNSHEQDSEITTEINKMLPSSPPTSYKDKVVTTETNDKEVLPISTFLLDTDDLDTTHKPSTLTGNDLNTSLSNDQMTANPMKENDSELLSVVPIEPENLQPLKKDYSNESIQELNDISDSPKKSERRTIDVNNLNSVINNVA